MTAPRALPRRILLLLAIGAGFAALPAAVRDLDAETLSVRERWERLSPDERAHLRDRYAAWQRLSGGEQLELVERARNLVRLRRQLVERLTPEEHERLRAMDEQARRVLLAEMLEDQLRQQGRRLHALIPEEWRERLEQGTPEERRQFFADFKERHRPRLSLVAIDRLGRLLGKEEAELQEWKRSPESERLERVAALRQELAARSFEESGLPAGIGPERWDEIRSLSPEDFFEEVQRIRLELLLTGPEPTEPESPSLQERRRAAALEILESFRHAPRERLELSHLPPPERRQELASRRRQRAQEILVRHQALPAELLERCPELSDDEFHAMVRRLVWESGVAREQGLGARRPSAEGR